MVSSSLNFLVNLALFTAYATAGNCRIFLFNKTMIHPASLAPCALAQKQACFFVITRREPATITMSSSPGRYVHS